jgi:hypothetical protein
MPRRAGILLLPLVLAAQPLLAREGFGFTKRAAQMARTKPPAVNVAGSRLRVKATSIRSDASSDAESLQKLAADAITAGDSRISESGSPDLDVRLSVERIDADDSWETKTDYEYRQTGTKEEWNKAKGKYEKKPVYGNVPVTKHIKVVEGKLVGTFEIRDGKGRVLDSGSFDQGFHRKYPDGDGAPTQGSVADTMLHDAAYVVAARIVPTKDRVTVVMPKGSFENFIPLAEKGQWDDYLDSVSGVPENKFHDQEAYRQYALAVGKEAVAYITPDRIRAAKLLEESLAHYRNAIAFNPDEKLFSEAHTSLFGSDAGAPLPRIEASVRAYQAWATGTPPVGRVAASSPRKSSKVLGNESVIEMAKAGLSDENIRLAIDAAESLDFDTTPDGLIALSKAGVSRGVIAHMQRKKK